MPEHMRNCKTHRAKTHFYLPYGISKWNTFVYIKIDLTVVTRAEWKKGICHKWSRGRYFSPSLSVGDARYLKLGSEQ